MIKTGAPKADHAGKLVGKRRYQDPTNRIETYDEVDVDLCRSHPLVHGMRFEYESERLRDSIRENGQLDPCRAVRDESDGVHLLIYTGQRRLHAIKNLKDDVGTPSTIKVIIDEYDLTDEDIVCRALAEDIDENDQRLSLSNLERVSYCRELLKKYDAQKTEKILSSSGLDRGVSRKVVSLVDKFDAKKLEQLHNIEVKSNFRFKIAHLDLLLDCDTEQNLYETASLAAFTQKPPEEIRTLRKASAYFVKNIPWFSELFPEFQREAKAEAGGSSSIEEEKEARQSKSNGVKSDESPAKGALPEPMILVKCHYCDNLNPFKLRIGYPEFIFCELKAGGEMEKLALGANQVLDCERECPSCHKSFWITASLLEEGRPAVKTSRSREITPPKQDALIRRVYWNQKGIGRWMLYDESSNKSESLEPNSKGRVVK